MAKIIIKKRVDLDFLGKEYEKGYLVFKSISLEQYQKLSADLKELKERDDQAVTFLLNTLRDQYIEGKFPNDKGELEDVSIDDLKDFDMETVINVFNRFTGQELPPKV